MDYSKYIVEGKGRCDLSLLFKNPVAFNNAVEEMVKPFRDSNITCVAALDALGFVFCTAVAQKLGVGLVLVRKGGKTSVDSESVSFTDYSNMEKKLEIVAGTIVPGERILLVDDWSETGAQLKAALSLLEKMEGAVLGVSCFNIDASVKDDPSLQKYHLHSVI